MHAVPRDRRWPDPEAGPYWLRLWVAELDGRPAVVRLEMWGVDVDPDLRLEADRAYLLEGASVGGSPDVAITSSTIRLPLDQMLQEAVLMDRARMRALQRMQPPEDWSEDREAARQAALAEAVSRLPKPRRGPHPLPDDLLRRVADIYREAVSEARRDPAKVVQYRLSDEMRRELKASTVRSWVRVAVERGYLEKPPRSATRATRQPVARATTTRRTKA